MSDAVAVDRQTRRLFVAVALLVCAVYLVAARGLPSTFDEQVIADTTASLAHGRATVETPLLNVFQSLAVKRKDGRQVGIYGIGTSVAGLPLYGAGKAVAQISPASKRPQVVLTATMFTDVLITAATVFMLMLVCALMGAPPVGAVLVGLSFGLGSYAFPHAITLFTEPGTALLVLSAVYFAIRASRGGRRADLVWCGACAAGALLFRVSAALFLPVIGVWLLVAGVRGMQPRRAVEWGAWYTLGAAGPIAVLLAVNRWRYGRATNFGYELGKATRQKYPILRGVAGQWLSSGKSLFLYAPIAVVVVLGLWQLLKRMPLETCLLGGIVLANTLFFARVQFWSGDWAWGPRYMQIVLPCLAAMAAPLMTSPGWRRALVALGVLGFVFAALPAVLVRFTLIWYAAFHAMPPPSIKGPPVWDHSYYALVWHTWHWQPIWYQLRLLPHAITNSLDHVTSPKGPTPVTISPRQPRLELWWLRVRDLGVPAVLCFAVLPIAAAAGGVRALDRYLDGRRATAPTCTGTEPEPVSA